MHCLPGTSYVLTRAPHLALRNYFRSHERMDKKMRKSLLWRAERSSLCQTSPNALSSREHLPAHLFHAERESQEVKCAQIIEALWCCQNYKGMGNTKVMGNWCELSNGRQLVEIKADQSADGSVSPNKMHFQLIFNAAWRPVDFLQIEWKMFSSTAFLCTQESCRAGNRLGLHQTNCDRVVV